jgi:hypothetical protein
MKRSQSPFSFAFKLDETLPNVKEWRMVISEWYTEVRSFSLGVQGIIAVFTSPLKHFATTRIATL